MVDNVAIWTGANYVPLDIDLPGTAIVSDFLQVPNGTAYLAFRTSGTAQVSSVAAIAARAASTTGSTTDGLIGLPDIRYKSND